jgi:glycerophosphoryl diester phosphodiesterase
MHMVEFDVHLTKDSRVVVFHDGDLERMCVGAGNKNRSLHVNDVNYEDLPMLKLPSEVWAETEAEDTKTREGGKEKEKKEKTKGGGNDDLSDPHPRQRIPLLTDVLSSLPATTCMTVEIKAHAHDDARTRDLVARTDTILKAHARAHDVAGRVIWFSLQAHANNTLLPACNPARPRITSARNATLFILAHWCGLLPFLPTSWISGGAACCGIVNPSSITVGLLRRVPGCSATPTWFLERLRPVLRPILASPSMVSHLRKRGMAVYMLGVNDAAALALASRCGVDAVLTDRPRWLAASAGLGRRGRSSDDEKQQEMQTIVRKKER